MSPRKAITPGTMLPPKTGVKVRMYNVGFGDCFLLAFPVVGGKAFYMLIDCGVHNQYKDGSAILNNVVKDIAQATGSHLNLVVITHEHTDHMLGFNYCQELFKHFTIDDLWLAWTEDPADQLAQSLKQQYGKRVAALTTALQKLKEANAITALNIESILGFEMPAAPAALSGKLGELEFLRAQSRKKPVSSKDYRHPGEAPLSLPGVKGVKVTVLGPPKSEKLIKDLEETNELYLEAINMRGASTFATALATSAADSADEEEKAWFLRSCPFDKSFRIPPADAQSHEDYGSFFKGSYGFKETLDEGPSWRRIDDDWLSASEELALSINSLTNNTSLVLALELSGGKVLLFAADAQVGNWLSWYDLPPKQGGSSGNKVDIGDLLARTVLYKVGHHGSRNATLKEKGLEKMVDPGLVAMLSVDEHWAKEVKKPRWEHPDPNLLERLV